ncbi:MAG: flagellar biosynthetic protein FliO [Verrucomicrobia bacterium]|nr:flagellar biosynthetic protein FliO [Verrucomicrobiota bacterium]
MKALGGKHALYVVGYQQQRLLLASSPGGVSLVSHLPEEDGASGNVPSAAPAVESASFVQALQQAVQAKVG